jgi:LmbE family N-acetylglucosaminyl deacetylase
MLADADIERILVVTAHPDDVDFGAGGTVSMWTEAGIEVVYCITTNGDAGGFDPDVPRSQIAGIRQREQRAAAQEVGVKDVRFLGYRDGSVEVTQDLRCDIARVIREVRPQRVLTQSPRRNFARIATSHPDHLAVGEATMCAVYPDARNPFAFPELAADGLEAWIVSEVWLSGDENPNHFVDVTDRFDRKLAALRAHESQTAHMDDLEERLRGWLGLNAERAGIETGRLAEAFTVLQTN